MGHDKEVPTTSRREVLSVVASAAASIAAGCSPPQSPAPQASSAAAHAAAPIAAPGAASLRPLGRTGAMVEPVSLGGEGILRTTGRHRDAVPVILEALRLGVRYC